MTSPMPHVAAFLAANPRGIPQLPGDVLDLSLSRAEWRTVAEALATCVDQGAPAEFAAVLAKVQARCAKPR